MDVKIAVRVLAVLAFGAAMTACVIALRPDGAADAAAQPDQPRAEASAELIRCRDIGVNALDDGGCRKAWAENRRRFFETDRPSETRPQPQRFNAPDLSKAGRS